MTRDEVIIKHHEVICRQIHSFLHKHPVYSSYMNESDLYGECALAYVEMIDKLFTTGKIIDFSEEHLRGYLGKVVRYAILTFIRHETAQKRNMFNIISLEQKAEEGNDFSMLDLLIASDTTCNPETVIITKEMYREIFENGKLSFSEKESLQKC